MIGIRADANSIIATGHVMRCISIAKAAKELGEEVTFFLADQESLRLFESSTSENEFQVVVLGTDWQNMEGELDILTKELRERAIKTLLVDSYSVTRTYFEKLREICKVAYLDDLNKEAYPVNMLINYSGYSLNMDYTEGYKDMTGYNDEKTVLYLGLQYAPLREQFYKETPDSEVDKDIVDSFARKDIRHVLIATGGADMCGMLMPLIDRIISGELEDKAIWHVVIGGFVENADAIIRKAQGHDNIVIHRAVQNMAYLMNRCDLAVMAAGTMLTECAACGLPTIFYQVADNQKFNVQYWGNSEGMTFAGDVSESDTKKTLAIDNVEKTLIERLSDTSQLDKLSASLKRITDGKGAIRIARALMGDL
jgi:UDP-2,4-diacetamido-2,4,6-trideoxy-beta-L-altropyranose hydrolase